MQLFRRAERKKPESMFQVGPDMVGDLRCHRPYFLVPLVDEDDRAEVLEQALQRILHWVDASCRAEDRGGHGKGPVTHLYVLSHGWHRNLYSAISAYDRLSSRFAQLLHRGRLSPTPQTGAYHPIFLNIHWHSDIGSNGFVDPAGRRIKDDFLARARHAFRAVPGDAYFRQLGESANLTNDFEDLFQLFSTLSAPDIDAMADSFDNRARDLEAVLDHYEIRDAPNATLYDKATAVWTCYHEASPLRTLREQTEPPGPSVSVMESLSGLGRFLVAVLGAGTVLGLVWKLLNMGGVVGKTRGWLQSVPWPVLPAWEWATLGVAAAWVTLTISVWVASASKGSKMNHRQERSMSLPLAGVLSWGVLTVVHALPYILLCLVTYPFHVLVPLRPFAERFGRRDEAPVPYESCKRRLLHARLILGWFACLPSSAIRATVRKESALSGVMDAVVSQLSFADMQIKAVRSAETAAEAILRLMRESEYLRGAEIHLVGHSFGGLLVTNLAKHLAFSSELRSLSLREKVIGTLTSLEGAFGSSWHDGEHTLLNAIERCVAAVYSRYDTANGFYFPLACHGAKAIGYVGAWLSDTKRMPVLTPLPCAQLTSTPDLARRVRQNRQEPQLPAILNVDASRIVFYGPQASGGGHGDIFKDDVIHLLWAIQNYRVQVASPVLNAGLAVTPCPLDVLEESGDPDH